MWGGTYVDVEVGIVDIHAVSGLLEVHVGDPVGTDIVVLDDAESSIGGHALDESSSGLEVSITLDGGKVQLGAGGHVVILGGLVNAVGVEVDGASSKTRLGAPGRVRGGGSEETE